MLIENAACVGRVARSALRIVKGFAAREYILRRELSRVLREPAGTLATCRWYCASATGTSTPATTGGSGASRTGGASGALRHQRGDERKHTDRRHHPCTLPAHEHSLSLIFAKKRLYEIGPLIV
jgi:hypothetical protein